MLAKIWMAILCGLLLCGCAAQPQITPEQKAQLDKVWSAYKTKDPAWLTVRSQALQDPLTRDFLIGNLLRELVQAANRQHSVDLAGNPAAQQPYTELVTIGKPAVPWLIAFYSVKNPMVAQIAAQLTADIGAQGQAQLVEAMQSAELSVRRWTMYALAHMQPPLQEDLIILALLDDKEWIVRGAAAIELRNYPTTRSRRALEKALQDHDKFVRQNAVESLVKIDQLAAVPALLNYLESALAINDLAEIKMIHSALVSLTQQQIGIDVEQWQQWWQQNNRP